MNDSEPWLSRRPSLPPANAENPGERALTLVLPVYIAWNNGGTALSTHVCLRYRFEFWGSAFRSRRRTSLWRVRDISNEVYAYCQGDDNQKFIDVPRCLIPRLFDDCVNLLKDCPLCPRYVSFAIFFLSFFLSIVSLQGECRVQIYSSASGSVLIEIKFEKVGKEVDPFYRLKWEMLMNFSYKFIWWFQWILGSTIWFLLQFYFYLILKKLRRV